MTNDRTLFSGKDLGFLIDGYKLKLLDEIASWEESKILQTAETDLIAHLNEKYRLETPRILREQLAIEKHGETKIDVSHRFDYAVRDPSVPNLVPGSYITVAIPFEGMGIFLNITHLHGPFVSPGGRL